MIKSSRIRGLLLSLLVVAVPLAANANGRKAEQLLSQGRKLVKEGNYAKALTVLKKARAISINAAVDLELATAHHGVGEFVEAAEIFESLLTDPGLFGGMVDRRDNSLAELRPKLGRITLNCKTDGAVVTINGRAVGKTPLSRSSYVLPGDIIVVVKAATWEKTIKRTLVAGQHEELNIGSQRRATAAASASGADSSTFDRTPAMSLDDLPPPPGATTAAPAANKTRAKAAPSKAIANEKKGGFPPELWGRRWTWITAAGSLVTGIVGMGLGIAAHVDYGTYKNSGTPSSQYADLESGVSAKATGANVMFVVAGALAITTAVLYFVEGKSKERSAKRGRFLGGATVRGDGAQASWALSF